MQIFEQANLKLVCSSIDSFYFQIPLVRNDLNREIDLIEEYTRFIGYKNFIEIYPLKEFSYYKPQDDHIKIIKEFFINYGFNEIITNPLVPNEKKRTEENSIFLTNPLNLELNILRYEFLSGLISVFESNLRLGLGLESKNYFEM